MQRNPTIDVDAVAVLPRRFVLADGRWEATETTAAAGAAFWHAKRAFDIVLAMALLPLVALTAVVLFALNRVASPGPLIFRQARMGRGGAAFTIYKFRSMLPSMAVHRGPEDPVEVDRITRFGRVLRRTRVDELPQIVNILRGEMSFVGPRPDMYDHARRFTETVPHYRRRHDVRPGITGYAQVTAGYAEGSGGTVEKARRDLVYIRCASPALEASIILRTAYVMVSGHGAR